MKPPAFIAAGMLAASLALAAPSPEEATPAPRQILSTDISGSDLDFFNSAARETIFVTQLSAMAKSRAVTPEVQALAAAFAKEQTDSAARLAALGARKEISLPREPDGQGKALLQALDKLKGPKFDKSYLDALSDAQDQLQASLTTGAASADKEIKAFADTGLAMLKQERDRIRKLGL